MTQYTKRILQTYSDKYALWTQLYGCIGLFGSFFVAMWEIPAYVGAPIISIFMFFSGCIICTINHVLGDMESNEIISTGAREISEKIAKGELPPERLDMYRRMF